MMKCDTVALPSTLWYFAIGSMCNPVSMELRNLTPLRSYPALLLDWKINFENCLGVADIAPLDTSIEFHGVLHLLSEEDFAKLDKVEACYFRQPVSAKLYDGSIIGAFAYRSKEGEITLGTSKLPSERYIDIIAAGCEHYKVDSKYVSYLRSHARIPRKRVEEFSAITNIPDKKISAAELQEMDGSDPAKGVALSIDFVVLKGARTAPTERLQVMERFLTSNSVWGTDVTLFFARILYDPQYPFPSTLADLSQSQKASIVDTFLSSQDILEWMEPIGRLADEDLDSLVEL